MIMEIVWQFQSFLIAGMIVHIGAEISLTAISTLGVTDIDGLNVPVDFECNSKVTLVCRITPYVDSAIWQVNGTSYALCLFQNCLYTEPFPENHNFSMDLTSEVFNLTVNPFPISANRSIYNCNNGINARSVEAILKVYPNNGTLKLDTSAKNQITVTTGCIYPSGKDDLTFEWFQTKDNVTLESEALILKENGTPVTFGCTETSSCGGEETAHFNNTVTFDVFDNGDDYYIWVAVSHKDAPNRPPAIHRSEGTYKLKENKKSEKNCPVYIIIVIAVIVRLHSIQTLFSGHCFYKAFPKDGLKQLSTEYRWMSVFASVPIVGFILAAITACRETKAVNPVAKYGCAKISIAFAVTLVDPAIGIFVTSLLYARAYEGAINWPFISLLTFGCLVSIGLETFILISCQVLCLDVKYALFTILYVVIVWICLVCIVLYLKNKTEKPNGSEDPKDKCNRCGGSPRYICQKYQKLLCDTCCKNHRHNNQRLHSDNAGQYHRGEDNSFTCQKCSKKSVNGYCLKCEQYLCVGCLKLHNKCGQGILRHQQHYDDREKEFCCESCKKAGHYITAAHAYCLKCSIYVCTLCLKTNHETCTLLWIQKKQIGTGQRLCCERIDDHREIPLEGVCLTCESFICAGCLNSPAKHKTHLTSCHQQEHGASSRGRHTCCVRYRLSEGQETINYCLDCQTYLCINCLTTHTKHSLFCMPSIGLRNPTDEIFCKGCETYKRLPVECYNLHTDEFLCAKCFERGHKSSRWKRTQSDDSCFLLCKQNIRNNQQACQSHSVLGESLAPEVVVYCLLCKLYMCTGCFKRHRRIAEYWITMQEGNLFYCNVCKEDEHIYPVECCNLETGEYMCANCYERERHFHTNSYAIGQDNDVKRVTLSLKDNARLCQIHMFPFEEQEMKILGTVYCLVCKLYLCKHCFELHRRLKDVWQNQQQHGPAVPSEVQVSTYETDLIPYANHPENSTCYQESTTNIVLLVLWHFPLAGTIIAFFQWLYQRERDTDKVYPTTRKQQPTVYKGNTNVLKTHQNRPNVQRTSPLFLISVLNPTVRLSPSIAEVLENGNVTLTCAYNGTERQIFSSWTKTADSESTPFISISGSTCKATGYLNNAELYAWGCLGNSTFTLTLKKVALSQHQDKWTCTQSNEQSNEITVFVKVPIRYVRTDTEDNEMIMRLENSTLQLKCYTSYCRPAPTVTWVLDSGTLDRGDDRSIVSGNKTYRNSTNDEGLVSVTSTIIFHLNRYVNGWRIYCSGKNIQNGITTISKATKLNITYPPDGPPVIEGYSNGSIYTVIDGHIGNLSCSITGGNPLAELTWYCYDGNLIPERTDTKVTNTVTWRASRDQSKTCKCTSYHTITGIISTEVNINVQYPPSLPVFSIAEAPVYGIVSIILNNTLSINCTSNSKPESHYIWTAPDLSTSLGQSLHIGQLSLADSGTYNCTAENRMFPSKRNNVTGSNTTSIDVDVLFSPSVPIFLYGSTNGVVIDNNSFDVVENDTFTITCSSSANPEPTFSWSGETIRHGILTISAITTDINKTCFATNTMNETVGESRIGSTEAMISVNVLYPPRKPIIRYFSSQNYQTNCLSNNLSVIENSSFSLSCTAISRPEPSYSWYGPITSKIANLKVVSINRVQKGEYSCNAFNTMKRTFGSSQAGKHTGNIYLNVLYPPSVGHVTNHTILEGLPFNISCPVNPGNPGQSIISWTRKRDTKQWNTQTLLLPNTRREDDTIYTCIAYNTMIPNCENETKGQARRSFHLNVVYRASVERFYVNGLIGQSEVTVNENDSLEFSCITESNPKSSITIGFNEKILVSKSDVNTLTYTNTIATCFHDGVYKCFGSNTYNNGEPSLKHVTLRVNSSAYPVPDQSGFKWQRQIGLMWTTLTNSKHIKITTYELQTNLTIKNVTKSDFGKYRLFIENAIGIYEQIYNLAVKAPPDKPSEFKVIEEETSNTSVTMTWEPGSTYGSVQYFILQYKKDTDDEWIRINVTDSYSSTINYTIEGLLSFTRYTANIVAMSNVGHSDDFFIFFQTKGKPRPPKEIEVISESVRETSITLQWKPGSDGGASQTFILKYSKFAENAWTKKSFRDTREQLQRQTINNLRSGSRYKLVLLSANRFGRSNESETITFQTKDSLSEKTVEQTQTPFIGLLTGLILSSILNIILIMMVIRLWTRCVVRSDLHKETKDTTLLRASYHSFIDSSGTCNSGAYEDINNETASGRDATEKSRGYTLLDIQTDLVKRKNESLQKRGSDGYEVPVSQQERKKSASDNKSMSPGADSRNTTKAKKYVKKQEEGGKIDFKRHTNPTEYINLEELSKPKP